MSQIAFIASDKELLQQSKTVINEIGLNKEVTMYHARLKKAVQLAQQLQNDATDVIIARGAAAQLIPAANIRIPVVDISISGHDLAHMFKEAKTVSGLSDPRIAFIAFSNMAPDLDALSDILGIRLTVFRLVSEEDIPLAIDKAAAENFDVLIGGKKTFDLAAARGLKMLLFHSGTLSIKTALLEAKKIALGRQIEKENAEKFKVLVDHSLEGIISINRDKTIQVCNAAAGHLMQCNANKFIGRQIDHILHLPDIDRCLYEGQPATTQVLRHGQNWLNINIAPIIVDRLTTGAFITLQDISRIQEAETTIRRTVAARKFTAAYNFSDILGRSPQLTETKRIALEFASADATTLIIGASGTGKELFAQSIHNNSSRRNGPFVAINCAALPPSLLESELFGYVEGAFTGATKKGKPGLFEMAHNGTIFLDEISEMDLYGQSRLLRVLQEKQVMRLGDEKYLPVDVRIIAATNKNLPDLIATEKFRQDLYYRLKVLVLKLPLLRTRNGDIEYLARHFLDYFNSHYQRQHVLTAQAYRLLAGYSWPGNVRELMHFLERLVVSAGEQTITEEVLARYSDEIETVISSPTPVYSTEAGEETSILAALAAADYNIKETAQNLGIARTTLYRKLKRYHIQIRKTN